MGICFSQPRWPRIKRSANTTAGTTANITANVVITKPITDHTGFAMLTPVHAAAMEPASGLGDLQGLPAELRLMIYGWVFLDSKPRIDISIQYETETSRILSSQTTHHGDELLYASTQVCTEALEQYWAHLTTISASRLLPAPSSGEKKGTATANQNTEPVPVDLGILVKGLPGLAIKNVVHLRNVSFPEIRGRATGEVPEESRAAALLARFKKLETVVFNEFQENLSTAPQWTLRSRDPVMALDTHANFTVYPSMSSPQQWLKSQYGLDVQDPSMGKIHFLKKAVEKRRPQFLWNVMPLLLGEVTEVSPSPPLAAAYLDFSVGKSYARLPDLPDEDGYELLVNWVEPSEPSDAKSSEDSESTEESPGPTEPTEPTAPLDAPGLDLDDE